MIKAQVVTISPDKTVFSQLLNKNVKVLTFVYDRDIKIDPSALLMGILCEVKNDDGEICEVLLHQFDLMSER